MKIHGGIFCILCYTFMGAPFMVLKWKVSHLKCLNHLNHNIAINSTSSHQCSIVLLFSITRLRLSREGIKNHLYITQLKSIASKIRGPPEPVAHRTWQQPHCTGQVYGQLYLLLQFWLQFAFLLAWLVLLSSPRLTNSEKCSRNNSKLQQFLHSYSIHDFHINFKSTIT